MTLLGPAFALIAVRTRFRFKPLLRLLTVLPIITPPFVIGLGIILLFGRSGVGTVLISDLFGIPPSRWIYGFSGLLLVQTLAFTPIAYLVLIGLFFVVINLAVDLLYYVVDPRLRVRREHAARG